TVRSRISMSKMPFKTRKKSSVSSCLCHTNSPMTLTTITSELFSCATVRGDQWSENVSSFAARLILLAIQAPHQFTAWHPNMGIGKQTVARSRSDVGRPIHLVVNFLKGVSPGTSTSPERPLSRCQCRHSAGLQAVSKNELGFHR